MTPEEIGMFAEALAEANGHLDPAYYGRMVNHQYAVIKARKDAETATDSAFEVSHVASTEMPIVSFEQANPGV
jgi:hypothetical protein